jgi:enoyl-CoA hydratase/carnithine racemase
MSVNDTPDVNLDRLLTDWLDADAAPRAPESLETAFVEGVASTRQRPAWATTERWISMETRAQLGVMPRALIALLTIALLAIGVVNGYAVGIGCIVTFCCDLLVASERAQWRLPQVALGILPAYGGGVRLARLVGKGHAMRMALGVPIPAEEAYRIGLAQWLVPHAKLMDKALEVAAHVAALPPLAARLTKESIVRGLDIPNLADASLVDLYRFAALELTEDKAEGHRAWREKRKPVFRGR